MHDLSDRTGYEAEHRGEREDAHRPNENKMSDGGRERASLAVKVWKSSQEWNAQRSAVRSIAWLDAVRRMVASVG